MSERKHKRRKVTCFLCSRVFRSFGELLEHKDRVHANGPTYACPLCRFNGPTRGMMWEKHVQMEHAAQIVKYRLKREDVTTVTQRPFLIESSASPVLLSPIKGDRALWRAEKRKALLVWIRISPFRLPIIRKPMIQRIMGNGGQTPEKGEAEEHVTDETPANEQQPRQDPRATCPWSTPQSKQALPFGGRSCRLRPK